MDMRVEVRYPELSPKEEDETRARPKSEVEEIKGSWF